MRRRVIGVRGGRLLVELEHDGVRWKEWEPVPAPDLDPTANLLAQTQAASPKPPPLGLYAKSAAQQARDRRREADKALKQHGVR